MSVFPFIEAEKAGQRNVAKACCLLEVSRSAFYEWHKHVPRHASWPMTSSPSASRPSGKTPTGTYGWPRVHRQLRRDGVHVSRKRVARIMRQKGLIGRCRRRWTRTTISDPGVVAVDLVRRAFGPGTVELDRVYVGDITYIWTWAGWAYLATVIDLASRRVRGLGAGRPHASRAGLRRPAHGHRAAPADTGADLPLRPRHPVHEQRVHHPVERATTSPSRCHDPANAGITPSPRASSPR